MNKKFQIIAHRGESREAPENTMASINLAWAKGAEAVEVDIHLSADNHVVVIHDFNTKRLGGRSRLVRSQTLAELKELDVGRWKDIKWTGEKIPLLGEVLATVSTGKKIVIEIKCGTEVLPHLKSVVEQSNLQADQIEFISFNKLVAVETKKIFLGHKVLLLSDLDYTWMHKIFRPSLKQLIKFAQDNNIDGLDLWCSNMINKKNVPKIKSAGLLLYVWTINAFEGAKKFKKLGVDGITTDIASEMKKVLFNSQEHLCE